MKIKLIKNILIPVFAVVAATALSILFQDIDVEEHITTVFVFAVFTVSLFTDGYIYGIITAFVSMFAINFAFTYPFFAFDFITPINIISAVIMILISVITSMLTTKIKHHESARAENERERMRANLLRAVSHDLRTPLTTIYTASSTLRSNKDSLTAEQTENMLQSIEEDSQWLVRMVENLLTVTRIDNDTMKISKTPTILDELVDSAVTKFSSRFKGIKPQISLPDEIVVIPVDTILIEQVIINLLENAVHHAKGMTTLKMNVFTLADQAVFEISDDGCGLDESKIKQLFSGSYSLKQDTENSQKRFVGIGLSVCATIIKAHGGTITAENRKGGGALFRFTLKTEEAENVE